MAGLLTSIALSGVPLPSSGRTDMFMGVLRDAAFVDRSEPPHLMAI
jgi:hypothetical protein